MPLPLVSPADAAEQAADEKLPTGAARDDERQAPEATLSRGTFPADAAPHHGGEAWLSAKDHTGGGEAFWPWTTSTLGPLRRT